MPIRYYCSDGSRVTQKVIDDRYSDQLRSMYADMIGVPPCSACGKPSHDTDHTIARARCKELHKTELIWDRNNMPRSCRQCHAEWENVKGLKWVDHTNVLERLLYLKKHDPEGYLYRMNIADL